ncbi:MAG TPA: dTDP-4-dehydrorhamnose 3,5-epimerase family protein [Allosphingosinicella sp.]|nr:dTDP-4-dehydrorhamnose 3,5-epimerase family protein [Allosphingosinicella sp.]
MLIEPTAIDGLSIIRWQKAHDGRGSFARTFCRTELAAAGLAFEVVQANLAHSAAARTLRGMHYQRAPHGEGKIVYCLRGRVWDAAVDMRVESPSYRKWHGIELAAGQPAALHIPAGFAHGYLTLEPDTEILYLVDGQYFPEAATGFRWDDPAIGIEWPAPPAIILPRDCRFPLLDPASGAEPH